MMAITAALEARGDEPRTIVLVPESAHGTNPATAALARLSRSRPIPADDDGRVDLDGAEGRARTRTSRRSC